MGKKREKGKGTVQARMAEVDWEARNNGARWRSAFEPCGKDRVRPPARPNKKKWEGDEAALGPLGDDDGAPTGTTIGIAAMPG